MRRGTPRSPAEGYLPWANSQGAYCRSIAMLGSVGAADPTVPTAYGMKLINAATSNPAQGRERAGGVSFLFDPETARPAVVAEAAYLSALRTGAYTMSSLRHLGPERFQEVTLIGCGAQARTHAELLARYFPDVRTLHVHDLLPERASAFASWVEGSGLPFTVVPHGRAAEAAAASTVVITLTITDTGYLAPDHLRPGTFVAHVSLDDLLPEVFDRAQALYVDDVELVRDNPRRVLGLLGEGRVLVPGAPKPGTSSIRGTLGDVLTAAVLSRAPRHRGRRQQPLRDGRPRCRSAGPGVRPGRRRRPRHPPRPSRSRPVTEPRGLYSLADLDDASVQRIVRRTIELHADRDAHTRPLAGLVAGLLFTKTSTRTRTAFTSGAIRLGGAPIAFGPTDLQTNTGESAADTGRMLAGMLDLLVVRTGFPMRELRELSGEGELPVVNAMSAEEHPTQGLADLATLIHHFGGLDGVRVLYVGEGNNTAVALARVLSRQPGCHAVFASLPVTGFRTPCWPRPRPSRIGAAAPSPRRTPRATWSARSTPCTPRAGRRRAVPSPTRPGGTSSGPSTSTPR